jgi:hypothetical protein
MQRVMRDVNERIADISRHQQADESEFLCECGREDCLTTIQVNLSDYEDARGRNCFILATGHVVPQVDSLVESRPGYDLVVQNDDFAA